MDRLDNLAYSGISNYFRVLSKIGYKSESELSNLLVLLFLEEFINSSFSIFVCEYDYKAISNCLYCLFGSSCMIKYPKFEEGSSLVYDLNAYNLRESEDGILRESELDYLRLVND